MSEIKSIVVMNPNQTPQAPIMRPVPKPKLVNTHFRPVSKPSTQQVPPFQTISMIPAPITRQDIEIIQPETKLPPLPPSIIKTGTSSLVDFLPVIGLGIVALFVIGRNQ
jgi:hypothetical protein